MAPDRAEIVAAEPAAIARAAGLLRAGRLVAFPTETVYGLGADATSDAAVAAVYQAKGRARENPLIVHVATPEDAVHEALLDGRAERLAARFWPGPLTLVLRRRADTRLSPLVSAGLDTVAIRVPAHPTALALLAETGRPVAAPSANPSGALSPTTAAHVAAGLGDRVALILDDGPCPLGVESTVVDLSRPDAARLLRPGGRLILAFAHPYAGGGLAERPLEGLFTSLREVGLRVVDLVEPSSDEERPRRYLVVLCERRRRRPRSRGGKR